MRGAQESTAGVGVQLPAAGKCLLTRPLERSFLRDSDPDALIHSPLTPSPVHLALPPRSSPGRIEPLWVTPENEYPRRRVLNRLTGVRAGREWDEERARDPGSARGHQQAPRPGWEPRSGRSREGVLTCILSEKSLQGQAREGKELCRTGSGKKVQEAGNRAPVRRLAAPSPHILRGCVSDAC